MWKVIYIAPNSRVADRIQERLTDEGLLVSKRHLHNGNGDVGGPVEILVPKSEAAEAHEILSRLLCSHS